MGMKRLFLLFTVCVFFSDIVYAYTCKIDGICYNLNKTNYTATVTYSGYPYNNDYTGHYGGDGLKDKDIVIPSTISYEDVEYTVTAIDDYAFWDAESKVLMSSVTIPSTVTSIGVLAFSKCENITSFTMPNSLTIIGSSAFSGCSRLSSIDIPTSVQSIGDFAFEGTAWYNSQPDGLVYAGRFAYKYKGTMPDNTSISIDEGTLSIAGYAFLNCEGLISVTIPSSVTSIGYSAFYGCSNLTSVKVDVTVPLSINTNTFSNRANATLYVPKGCKAAYEAADYWKEFKEIVEVSPNIEFADDNVKALCVANWDTNGDGELNEDEAAAVTNLGTVFNENTTITSFDELHYFTGLTTIGANVIDNYENTFYRCTNLTSLTLPNSVTTIGQAAFYGCSSLTSLTIPDGVTSLGWAAFYGCSQLTSISIPNGVNAIPDCAFLSCRNLQAVSLPTSVTSIGKYAFRFCGLSSITIPSHVKTLGEGAYLQCAPQETLTIPNTLTSIGDYAFAGTKVGTLIFRREVCDNVGVWLDAPSIDRPCHDKIVFGKEVKNISFNYFGIFSDNIEVEDGNSVYDSRNGCNAVIESATNTLIAASTNTVIPNTVVSIARAAFYNSKITSVTIPSSVKNIGSSAFYGCNNLTSVTVEAEVPLSLSAYIFSNRANATLYVPAGCKAAYEAAPVWREFKEIVEQPVNNDNAITIADLTACRGGQVQLPVSMNNLEQIVGFQFDLLLPEGITVATDAHGNYVTSLTDRKDDHTLSVSKVGDNQYRFVSVSMNNKPFAGNDGALVNVKLKVDKIVTIGSHTVTINGTELTTIGKEAINAANAVAMLTVKDAELGDVNGDMTISVTDVVAIISHILNDTPASFIESAADINGDSRITVTDAVGVIDMILNKQ